MEPARLAASLLRKRGDYEREKRGWDVEMNRAVVVFVVDGADEDSMKHGL